MREGERRREGDALTGSMRYICRYCCCCSCFLCVCMCVCAAGQTKVLAGLACTSVSQSFSQSKAKKRNKIEINAWPAALGRSPDRSAYPPFPSVCTTPPSPLACTFPSATSAAATAACSCLWHILQFCGFHLQN